MKNILLMTILLISTKMFCQANIYFPLEIGNKFYYKAGSNPDNGYFGVSKTIIDSLSNGTRVTSVKKYFNDSTSISTEYWLFNNNKFYVSSSPSFSYPIFDGNILKDSCVDGFFSDYCYELFDSTIFNENCYCQSFKLHYFNKIEAGDEKFLLANGIGYYLYWNSLFKNSITKIDSITLVGFIKGNTLIGDSIITTVNEQNNLNVTSFFLYQNYPNPFNPKTRIGYSVPYSSLIKIAVYDVLGNELVTLVNEEKTVGNYFADFNGEQFPSGVYFYRLIANTNTITRKLMLLK